MITFAFFFFFFFADYSRWIRNYLENLLVIRSPSFYVPHDIIQRLPSYDKAECSADNARLDKVAKDYLSPLVLAQAFEIAQKNDEEQFCRLVDLYKALKKRERGVNPLKVILATCWTSHFLWLMTNEAGVKYLKDQFKLNVSIDAYRIEQKRLHLFKHPKAAFGVTDLPLSRDKIEAVLSVL